MKKLIFLGTNSVLTRYIEAADRQNQEILGIIDSDWYGNTESFCGLPIINKEDVFDHDSQLYRDCVFFIGTNWVPVDGYQRDNNKRQMFIDLVKRHGLTCVNLIDPMAYVSKYATLGNGVYVGPFTSIEPGVVIHDFSILWGSNCIGHDSVIGENTVFQRWSGFHGEIGENSYVGMYTKLFNNGPVKIGKNVNINPFLYIAKDINDGEHIALSKEQIKVYRHTSRVD
jgi:acyl-[acyl carrier protein]--UDP-N-acetylglucosamine O-acyltransferase